MIQVTGYRCGKPFDLPVVQVQPGMYLSIDAAEAWNRMADLARLDGVDLRINSAWRSIEDQRTLMARWASRFDAWSKLEASSRGQRPPKPALPGWSRHQSGVAVDIQRSHDAPDGGGQMVGLTDRWLAANARRFGFSATVPGEPWHFEWVG